MNPINILLAFDWAEIGVATLETLTKHASEVVQKQANEALAKLTPAP